MKRLLTLLLLLAVALPASAQKEKVVERSAKKAPAWLGISCPDYFTVSATAPTLDQAQKQCLTDIRQHIITSIASNITSEEKLYQEQTARNGVVSLLNSYASEVGTTGASMPYLCDISLSRALGVYWERRFVKQEKSYYYIYHVQYPFTDADRSAAIAAFRALDNEHLERLEQLEEQFETFTDLSFLDQTAAALNPLIDYFFDTDRRNRAVNLQQRCRQACGEVAIVPDSASLGCYCYHLALHGRRVTSDRQPRLESDYATNLRVVPLDGGYALLYDEAGIEGEENFITMTYTFGGRRLQHRVVFDPTEGKLAVRPFGTVEIDALRPGADSVATWRISVPLRSNNDTRFEVRHVDIRVPEFGAAAQGSLAGYAFEGKGVHTLRFTASVPQVTPARRSVLLNGTLRIVGADGRQTDVRFNLPYRLNFTNR